MTPDALARTEEALILASQSRARQMLLANAGIEFEPCRPISTSGQLNRIRASRLRVRSRACSREKALWVSQRKVGHYVIGADQTLALGDRLFNKPGGRAGAAEQIRALSGQTHALHSAIAVVRDGQIVLETVALASMTMRSLGDADIAAYLDAAGEAVHRQRRRLPTRGTGRPLVRTDRGRSLHRSGPAALAPCSAFLRSQHLLAL